MKLVIGVTASLYKIKKLTEEIKILREQISKKNFIIRNWFSLKLSNCQEDNLPYIVKKY